jgi:hypothetical protein
MPVTRGLRTIETSSLRRDRSFALQRLGLGVGFLGLGLGAGLALHGWAWALTALLGFPGAFALLSAARPWVAPCPACGAPLGAALVLPGDPILRPDTTDLRCASCGLYFDALGGLVREVPFHRVGELPTYTVALDGEHLEALVWASVCVCCGKDAARRWVLEAREVGVLGGRWGTLEDRGVPYCDAHGEGAGPGGRGVEVARTRARAQVRFGLYAAYRIFLDGNRERVDVEVKALREPLKAPD